LIREESAEFVAAHLEISGILFLITYGPKEWGEREEMITPTIFKPPIELAI